MRLRMSINAHLQRNDFGDLYRVELSGDRNGVRLLKVLRSREHLRRFRDEAYLFEHLAHPALLHGKGLTSLDGQPATLLSGVDGFSLRRLLKRRGPLPPQAAADLIGQLARLLDVLFNDPPEAPLRLVHRGLTPDRILVTPHGQVILSGMMTARASFSEREAMTLKLPIHTLRSPSGRDHQDPRLDTYGLGALLFALLTAQPLPTQVYSEAHHLAEIDARVKTRCSTALRQLLRQALRHQTRDRPLPGALGASLRSSGALQAYGAQTIVGFQAEEQRRARLTGGLVGSMWGLDRGGTFSRLPPGSTPLTPTPAARVPDPITPSASPEREILDDAKPLPPPLGPSLHDQTTLIIRVPQKTTEPGSPGLVDWVKSLSIFKKIF